MMLKFWMKKQNLIGSSTITSYALTMLVIFYLQRLDKPILPTVELLRQACPLPHYVASWDVSFSTDRSLLPPVHNCQSLLDLMTGFFVEYSTFEFGLYVICPFNGKLFTKLQFKSFSKKEKESSFNLEKFMCLQDPFKLNHNITQNVNNKVRHNFQQACATAVKLCLEESKRCDNKDYKSEFFKVFLDTPKTNPCKKQKGSNRILIDCGLSIGSHKNQQLSEEELRRFWAEKVLKVLLEILTKVMRCKVERRIASNENSSEDGFMESLVCQMDHEMLSSKKRNLVLKNIEFPSTLSVIEKQVLISEHLWNQKLKDAPTLSLKFTISCFLRKNPTCVLLELESLESGKSSKGVINNTFFSMQSVLGKWISSAV